MKKLAIIGASYLQAPLIQKAKDMGIETHTFAWAANDVGETLSDYFYPISIVEKEAILEKCRAIGIDGICSISSDLAMQAVNFIADRLHLTGNTLQSTLVSTNKHCMRERFKERGDPSPMSFMVSTAEEALRLPLNYPVIVKPLDRSGSRGITKVTDPKDLESAIERARGEGFDKHALVEEFAEGDEYSVEFISWKGKHEFLAMTKKFTTGAPNFIETGHIQPADVDPDTLERVKAVISHALDSLEIEYGASHSEVKIDGTGRIVIIEIGGRMGGDFIGSHLVQLSTGFDFLKGVIDIALGREPDMTRGPHYAAAAVRYVIDMKDHYTLRDMEASGKLHVIECDLRNKPDHVVKDSATRCGYLVAGFDSLNDAYAFINK